MIKTEVSELKIKFDEILNIIEDSNIEYWYGRELMGVLGYTEWRNFQKVITKGITACINAGVEPVDHFVEVNKMVQLGSGSEREIKDIILTRYACYLIAQNGDSRKKEISFAQNYFAIQARKQELLEQHIELQERLQARHKLKEAETELSQNIYERGVDENGFGRIRSKGDSALFGGKTTQNMKDKLLIPKGIPLADFLPTITIAAKNLATEITNLNVKKNNLQGENLITDEHIQNNKSVRTMLAERGIKPEELEAEEDLKKLQRRVKRSEEKIIKESKLPLKLIKDKQK